MLYRHYWREGLPELFNRTLPSKLAQPSSRFCLGLEETPPAPASDLEGNLPASVPVAGCFRSAKTPQTTAANNWRNSATGSVARFF